MSRAGIVLPRIRDVFRDAIAAGEYSDADVYLGPIVSGDPDDAVFVGYDGDPFGDMEMIVHTQNWGAIGNKARDEEFDIRCTIMNRSGQTDAAGVQAAVTRLYGMFSELAAALNADPSIGLGPPTTPIMRCEIRGLGSFMPLTDVGVEPRVTFSVHVKTRL